MSTDESDNEYVIDDDSVEIPNIAPLLSRVPLGLTGVFLGIFLALTEVAWLMAGGVSLALAGLTYIIFGRPSD